MDSMTWPLFIQALTNLVAIEKVTKVKRLVNVGNVSVKSGGKKSYPQASSIPELVRKMGCMRCLQAQCFRVYCSKDSHLFTL